MSLEDRRAQKREYQKAWRLRNPTYFRDYAKRHYAEKAPRYIKYARRFALQSKYGLTIAQYEQMLTNQDGACAICGKLPGKVRLAVDHNHTTGKVRKLLCNTCNIWVGVLENADFRLKAEAYLRAHA